MGGTKNEGALEFIDKSGTDHESFPLSVMSSSRYSRPLRAVSLSNGWSNGSRRVGAGNSNFKGYRNVLRMILRSVF